VHNLSYENESYLHENENSFSYERLCTKTCFEKEVYDNSEMAYSVAKYLLALSWSFFFVFLVRDLCLGTLLIYESLLDYQQHVIN